MIPASNYVLLDVKIKEDTSTIITPEMYRKKEPKGVILAIGRYCSLPLKVGDEVYYSDAGSKTTEFGLIVPQRSLTLIKE